MCPALFRDSSYTPLFVVKILVFKWNLFSFSEKVAVSNDDKTDRLWNSCGAVLTRDKTRQGQYLKQGIKGEKDQDNSVLPKKFLCS